MRRFSAVVLTAITFLLSAAIAIFSGILLLSIIEVIFHTKNPGAIAMIIVFATSIGVLWVSCTYLSKAMEFVIDKLIEWMYKKPDDENLRSHSKNQII